MALVTVCFNVGSIVTAQVTGAVLPALGWPGLLLTLATLLMLTLLACVVLGSPSLTSWERKTPSEETR